MQLHNILDTAGFLLLVLGICAMDSDPVTTPVVMVVLGLAFLACGARESGNPGK